MAIRTCGISEVIALTMFGSGTKAPDLNLSHHLALAIRAPCDNGYAAARPFVREHLIVQGGHRHDADDVVRLRLVAAIDDVALLFVGEHRIGGRRTVRPGR